jgi:hypothetical protein
MRTFKVVNPYIVGQMAKEYKADNGIEAAKNFWDDFSKHLINNVPKLYITLQSGDELTHYKISEKISKGKKLASYTIEEHKVDLESKLKKYFLNEIKEIENKVNNKVDKQLGGKDKDKNKDSSSESDTIVTRPRRDSSSSDSDSDDYYNFAKYRHLSRPISFYWYAPYIYRVSHIYTPTFNAPDAPYSQLWLSWHSM